MIVPEDRAAEFSDMLAIHMTTDLAARFQELGRPAVHLRLDDSGNDSAGGSRLGGYPVLPAEVAWPTYVHGGSDRSLLVCMAVLSLAQLAPYADITGLPHEGWLTFFYADDAVSQPWGGELEQAGGWQVLYAPPGTAPAPAPAGVTVWKPYPLSPEKAVSYPSPNQAEVMEALAVDKSLHGDDYWEIYDAAYDCRKAWGERMFGNSGSFNRNGHQLSGNASPNQDDPIGEADWLLSGGQPCGRRLLLQIDGDRRMASMIQHNSRRGHPEWLGLDFTIYYIIEDADLRNRDFSNVWLIAQR